MSVLYSTGCGVCSIGSIFLFQYSARIRVGKGEHGHAEHGGANSEVRHGVVFV